MLSYLLCCFKWNFSGIFFPFFVLSNQCGLSCLKKSVLPLKNFSFIIKSTAPSNIKCLKNVLTSQSGFLIVFSTHLKKKLSFFFLICIFQRQKKTLRSPLIRIHAPCMKSSTPYLWVCSCCSFPRVKYTWHLWDFLALKQEGGALRGEKSTSKFRYCHLFWTR